MLLLPGVLAGQASDVATTRHVDVGVIAGMGGDYLPKRYVGIGVWSPTWRARRIEIGAMATLLGGGGRREYAIAWTGEEGGLDTS